MEVDRQTQSSSHAHTRHLVPDGLYLHKTKVFLASFSGQWELRTNNRKARDTKRIGDGLSHQLSLGPPPVGTPDFQDCYRPSPLRISAPNVTQSLSSDGPLTFEETEEQLNPVLAGGGAVLEF